MWATAANASRSATLTVALVVIHPSTRLTRLATDKIAANLQSATDSAGDVLKSPGCVVYSELPDLRPAESPLRRRFSPLVLAAPELTYLSSRSTYQCSPIRSSRSANDTSRRDNDAVEPSAFKIWAASVIAKMAAR